MDRVVLLGSSGAMSDADRDNTYLAAELQGQVLLFDCAGSPVHKLARAGMAPEAVSAVFLTHGHVDHVYGLPSLIFSLVGLGRTATLAVWCPRGIERSVEALLSAFGLLQADGAFPIVISPVSLDRAEVCCAREEIEVSSFPVRHGVPAVGYKVRCRGKSLVYSGNTVPTPALIEAATGADYLIHECTYASEASTNHTNLDGIREIVLAARPRRTVLVHFEPSEDFGRWQEAFPPGTPSVELGHDFLNLALE